ncbi:hypothetical protein [Sphingopyxis macrogoltabida]|uniref:hypothetical protein n=1 Tax=Sphingopyxis macrogoltabida TaxID=33050 RepID=UPI0011EA69EE|nr:hypothetical protein [Sphingopyxis macrogoltabida]
MAAFANKFGKADIRRRLNVRQRIKHSRVRSSQLELPPEKSVSKTRLKFLSLGVEKFLAVDNIGNCIGDPQKAPILISLDAACTGFAAHGINLAVEL